MIETKKKISFQNSRSSFNLNKKQAKNNSPFFRNMKNYSALVNENP